MALSTDEIKVANKCLRLLRRLDYHKCVFILSTIN